MKKISLIAASLLLASNLVAADESFDSAIKGGSISGDVTLYGERQNNSGSNKDAGLTSGSIGLGYETGSFYGFKANVGFRANHDFYEVEDGNYSDDETTKAILHTANISYTNEYFGLTAGRQEIDLEWMGDYHEAVVASITAIPDTTVVLGYTNRVGAADADAPLSQFDDLETVLGVDYEVDYAFVLDVKYEGVEGLVVNPYYYDADNTASWYGLKLDYDTDVFGVTLHGAVSDENVSGTEDGQIVHLDVRGNISGLSLSAGYITTDTDGGAGSMTALGDNISPFEDGNYVYDPDADTYYFGLGYEVSGVELSALYGQTKYDTNKEKELNLSANYGITDNLAVGALFVDVNAEDGDDDYNRVALTLEYSF